MTRRRTVFFVSDRTGITVEVLGVSLLGQFAGVIFEKITLPFIDSLEKARQTVDRINRQAELDGERPIVFCSLVELEIANVVFSSNALVLDVIKAFTSPLEEELGVKSSHLIGTSHSATNPVQYHERIDAVNFALNHDDGLRPTGLEEAKLILVGVSRCGKTPTCLYMALQFGIMVANYPFLPEDLASPQLPKSLKPYHHKIYGLTIQPERLSQIRAERRPGSSYAELDNCHEEIRLAERLMRAENIQFIDTTTKSIEELATKILDEANLERRFY